MNENSVVIIRNKIGHEIIGIFISEDLDKQSVKIFSPFYAKIDMETENLILGKYCILSDEIYFEFNKSDMEFLVPAKANIAINFTKMLFNPDNQIEQDKSFVDSVKGSNVLNFHNGNKTLQ